MTIVISLCGIFAALWLGVKILVLGYAALWALAQLFRPLLWLLEALRRKPQEQRIFTPLEEIRDRW